MTTPPIAEAISQNGNAPAEEKEVREYGRMVLFVVKHKAAFALIGSMIIGAYTTIQTMKGELEGVKSDVTTIKQDLRELKDVLIEPTPMPRARR